MDVADACHARGVQTVAVTAGYISPGAREEFYAKMDAANVDLKAFTDEFYFKLCGAHLQPVLDTLVYLKHETDVWFEITTLLIPGKNDSAEEIEAECKWIMKELGPDVPVHFTAFHPDYKMTTSRARRRRRSRARARSRCGTGLHYVYTGNVHDTEGGTTVCPGCGNAVIVRDWHRILNYRVTDDGTCRECGAAIAGRFEEFENAVRAAADAGAARELPRGLICRVCLSSSSGRGPGPAAIGYATLRVACRRLLGLGLTTISTSRPRTFRKRSNRSSENPPSRPRTRAETLG